VTLPKWRSILWWLALLLSANCYAGVDEGIAAYRAGDYAKAMAELRPLADQGNAIAQRTLASMFAVGRGVKEDDAQAIAWWTKAAEQGDAQAQWELGGEYTSGTRVRRDYQKAFAWSLKSAEQGYGPADINVASFYTGGYGDIGADQKQVVHWLRLAADQNTMGAASWLGDHYAAGVGVPRDAVQAVYWWLRATSTDRNAFSAQANLGESYELGRGVERNYTQALAWYQKAAFMNEKARLGLARMYNQGLGTAPDAARAAAIYGDLAAKGSDDAQRYLAGMYERGEGVPRNLEIAAAWYEVLATHRTDVAPLKNLIGNVAPSGTLEKIEQAMAEDAANSKAHADQLLQQLTAEQAAKAHELAQSWRPGQLISDADQ
jgi:TPR repeat protein